MYYASDKSGNRVFIDNAQKGIDYYCPACKAKMIMKCGDIVAHHFSHKARKLCDPWYKDRMSDWHRKLQSMFPEDCQEVTVWNDSHSEVHFADVMFSYKGTGHVLEFQHSPITRKEFISRSSFYLGLGYKLTWIFDFCECEKPKKFYTRERIPLSMKLISCGRGVTEYAFWITLIDSNMRRSAISISSFTSAQD